MKNMKPMKGRYADSRRYSKPAFSNPFTQMAHHSTQVDGFMMLDLLSESA